MKNKKPPVIIRLVQYMAKDKLRFVVITIFTILSSLAGVVGTASLEPIINDYIVPFIGKENVDLTGLIERLGILVIVYVIGSTANYLQKWLVMYMTNDTLHLLREDLMNKMMSLPIKYFDDRTNGEIMSRFTNDVEIVRQAVQQSLVELLGAILSIAGIIIAMLRSNIPLSILAIIMFLIMLFIVRKLGKVSGEHFKELQILIGDANGYLEELIEGQKVVKVFNYESQVEKEFNDIVSEVERVGVVANTYSNYVMPVTFNISFFHYIITAVLGSYMSIMGTIDIGQLITFMQFTRSLGGPITQISQQFNLILMALAGAERIFDIIDIEPEIDEGDVEFSHVKYDDKKRLVESKERTGLYAWKYIDGSNMTKFSLINGDIKFSDVTFSYNGTNKVLENISINAKSGQKVALVGSTGAGKTTITNLLTRFYEIDEGSILYDGINITKIKKSSLRRSLSIVLQDTNLFTTTVRENIRFGRLDATDEEIIEAAKLANAHEFIENLSDGYDTVLIDSGASLSQGQRQLLSIARASVADPVTLILDEATSSIDTRTEKLIQEGMNSLMKGRTTFVIAHRLSTIQNSDVIMVLEHGKIIEYGNHDDLLSKKGRYHQLYTGMFELN